MNAPRSELLTPRIQHDQPLDQSGERVEFNFEAYANTFARLIADRTTRTPLVILISGKWGTGKTTLLNTVKRKLDETVHLNDDLSKVSFVNPNETQEGFRRCRTVWFNAWKYADEDQLLVALIRVIVQTMAQDDVISKALGKLLDPAYPRRDVVATVLSWFAIKLPGVEVKPNTGEPKETPFAQNTALLDLFSDAFDQLAAAWVHRSPEATKIDASEGVMAVFIDDLDRCLPEKVVQVLEAIKLFLDRRGVAFVLAADEAAVQSAVEAHYQNAHVTGQRASDYLEKIFQARFPLPPLSDAQVRTYLDTALEIPDEHIRRNVKLLVAGSEANPRQIKTFINYLEIGWAMLTNSGQAANVNKTDFVYWLALTRVGPAFCEKMRRLPPDLRLNFVQDAARWASGATEKAAEYEEWKGFEHQRLRDVLRLIEFSPQVTPPVLEGFIFWSAAAAPLVEEPVSKTPPVIGELRAVSAGVGVATGELRAALEGVGVDASGRVSPMAEYWITIPAGKFVMGSRADNPLASDDERPQHTVELTYDFQIARYPVTNAEFEKFVKATGHSSKAVQPDRPDHPVVNVTREDAQVYCKWQTGQLRAEGALKGDEVVRLPTEAEWEKAARGEYGREWPWGDEWDPAKCNTAETGPKTTTPVGQYSPQGGDSPYGVADMVGNVWEWCADWWQADLYQQRKDQVVRDPKGPASGSARVVRGGSWGDDRRNCRAASRLRLGPDDFSGGLGFRVARSP